MRDPQRHRRAPDGQLRLFSPSPTGREREPEIVGFGDLKPVRRGRELLVMAGPPRRIRDMSEAEIEALAGQIVDGMAKRTGQRRSTSA